MAIFSRNNEGFTLIEVLVAIVIMMVGMLGLLQTIIVAMEVNLKNQLQDEAVYVGAKYMNALRAKPFDSYSVTYPRITEPSRLRGGGVARNYNVDMRTSDLSTNAVAATKQLRVDVYWTYKGVTHQNSVTSPVSIIR